MERMQGAPKLFLHRIPGNVTADMTGLVEANLACSDQLGPQSLPGALNPRRLQRMSGIAGGRYQPQGPSRSAGAGREGRRHNATAMQSPLPLNPSSLASFLNARKPTLDGWFFFCECGA